MEKGPGVEPKRVVAIFYIFAAVVVGIFLVKILGLGFSYARLNDVDEFLDLARDENDASMIAVIAADLMRKSGARRTIST